MKKSVLTFGLIGGAIMAAMMFATMPFMDKIGFDKGEVIGYTTMIVAFMLVSLKVRKVQRAPAQVSQASSSNQSVSSRRNARVKRSGLGIQR
jgi:hypothetical protein